LNGKFKEGIEEVFLNRWTEGGARKEKRGKSEKGAMKERGRRKS